MRKVIKLCLAVAMFGMVSGSVTAEETKAKVTGRALGFLSSYSYKSGNTSLSETQFKYNGRIGASVSGKEGDLTIGGSAEVQIDGNALKTRDVFAFIENKQLLLEIGRVERGGITMGGEYLSDYGEMAQYAAGEEAGQLGLRRNSIHASLKDLGVSLAYSVEYGTNGEYNDGADKTDGKYKEDYFFLKYEGEFGNLALATQYSASSTSLDTADADQNKLDGTKYDGGKQNAIAVAAQYSITDDIAVALNVDQTSSKEGGANTETLSNLTLQSSVDYRLNEKSGVSLAYGQFKEEYSAGNTVTYNSIIAGYTYTIGGGDVFAQYASETGDSANKSEKKDNSEVSLGLKYSF